MTNVLHLRRELTEPPAAPVLAGVVLRNFQGPEDVDRWLDLRHRAFAREKVGVRQWNHADFAREFQEKAWWSPSRMWFAEANADVVGTVTLADRGAGPDAMPVVHWLAVATRWRRRGVARLLMSALETTCWEAGRREIWLETHADWSSAVRFYEALGYRPA